MEKMMKELIKLIRRKMKKIANFKFLKLMFIGLVFMMGCLTAFISLTIIIVRNFFNNEVKPKKQSLVNFFKLGLRMFYLRKKVSVMSLFYLLGACSGMLFFVNFLCIVCDKYYILSIISLILEKFYSGYISLVIDIYISIS